MELEAPDLKTYNNRREEMIKNGTPEQSLNYFDGLLPTQKPLGSYEDNMKLLQYNTPTVEYKKAEADLIASLLPSEIEKRCKRLGQKGLHEHHLLIALIEAQEAGDGTKIMLLKNDLEKVIKESSSIN